MEDTTSESQQGRVDASDFSENAYTPLIAESIPPKSSYSIDTCLCGLEPCFLIVYFLLALAALICNCFVMECILLALTVTAFIFGMRLACLFLLIFVGIFTLNNWSTMQKFAKEIT